MNCCPTCPPQESSLSLEDWREVMCCIDPWPFWQWKVPVASNAKTVCDPITREYQYHSKNLGRHEIRQALTRAEQILTKILGYPPVPVMRRAYIDISSPLYLSGLRSLHKRFSVSLPDDFVIDIYNQVSGSLGIADVVLSSEFAGNGIYDTFTLTLPIPANVNLGDIEVRFIKSDQFDSFAPSNRWKVSPISWRQDTPGILTITGRAWTIGIPKLTAQASQPSLDPTILANYVSKLEIFNVTKDYEINGKIIVEPKECVCGSCSSCNECLDAKFCYNGDGRATFVEIANQTSECDCSCRKIVGVCVEYSAGDCEIDWTKTIAQLAVAELGCCICACDYPCLTELWQDISLKGKERTLSAEMLNNGLGLRMGHYLTYLAVEQFKLKKDNVSCW